MTDQQTSIAGQSQALPLSELSQAAAVPSYVDPLDRDAPDDELVVTTTRGQARVALVASELSKHFASRGVATEPMAWMMSPRRLFGGRTAIDACVDLDACTKALLLHGLDLGMDADPDDLDAALIDDDDGYRNGIEPSPSPAAAPSSEPSRLFTVTLSHSAPTGHVQAFAATVAPTPDGLLDVLQRRYGVEAARQAEMFVGFDPRLPMAEALVSPAMAYTLVQIAEDPASPLAKGLDVLIEQRFDA